ncbi:MAG TPA: orotidine-5'-phosphate decarboxylase, partial [Thiomicrospira sp.]|nr:orotidine-5'-phosphate decarboxylase [Thiomicrospira sp.]
LALVTPGIRPMRTDFNDQKRIMTPNDAIASGSSFLVIGRPIIQSKNPLQTLIEINNSLEKS